MRAPDHIAKPSSGLLLLAAVAVLSLWPPLLAIAEGGTFLEEALAEGDEVTEVSTSAVLIVLLLIVLWPMAIRWMVT